MRLVIVTGMSGAGKSSALKMLEDMGYFCVDNLPIPLLTRFVEMFSEPDEEVKKIALGIDVRGGQDFDGLKEVLDELDSRKTEYEILFLDAQDNVLVKRYKETRRQHPLSGSGRVDTGIAKERAGENICQRRGFLQPVYHGHVLRVQIRHPAGFGSGL